MRTGVLLKQAASQGAPACQSCNCFTIRKEQVLSVAFSVSIAAVSIGLQSIRVGGEVDSFCTRCNMNLAATILAMVGTKIVRVRCNTCGSDRTFRGVQPLEKKAPSLARSKAPSTASPRTPRAVTVVLGFDEQLKGKDISRAKKYSPKDSYKVDDVINHPSFGLGFVTAVRSDKVDIAFKSFEKTLVHGKT